MISRNIFLLQRGTQGEPKLDFFTFVKRQFASLGTYSMKSNFSFIFDIWACMGPTLPAHLSGGSQVPESQVRNPCHSSLRNGIGATPLPPHSVPVGAGAIRRHPLAPVSSSILPVTKHSRFIPGFGKSKAPLHLWDLTQGGGNPSVVPGSFLLSASAANCCSISQGPPAKSHKASPFLLHLVLFYT